jgi:hypothetical protein
MNGELFDGLACSSFRHAARFSHGTIEVFAKIPI